MAEANKCDVKGCEIFAEGAPVAKFILSEAGIALAMCETHAEEIVNKYFPHLIKEEEEDAPVDAAPADAAETPAGSAGAPAAEGGEANA